MLLWHCSIVEQFTSIPVIIWCWRRVLNEVTRDWRVTFGGK